MKSGGLSIDQLDRLAFGFAADDITQLHPSEIKIKWTQDLINVKYEQEESGLSKKEWAKTIDLSEPIVVIYDKFFYLDDGHHRWYAAKILNKMLNVELEIEQKPIPEITDLSYDDFMIFLFNSI